jgi:hypothetical protein
MSLGEAYFENALLWGHYPNEIAMEDFFLITIIIIKIPMMLGIIGKNKIKNSTRHFEKLEHSLLQVFHLPKCLTNFYAL